MVVGLVDFEVCVMCGVFVFDGVCSGEVIVVGVVEFNFVLLIFLCVLVILLVIDVLWWWVDLLGWGLGLFFVVLLWLGSGIGFGL